MEEGRGGEGEEGKERRQEDRKDGREEGRGRERGREGKVVERERRGMTVRGRE